MALRKLVSIQLIKNLEPIKGADRIEKATVLGWSVVVKKGEFKIGEKVVYCEIDSVLPDRPEFEFLRERKFRIKTMKLRKQISQGIVFPLSVLPSDIVCPFCDGMGCLMCYFDGIFPIEADYVVGVDVTKFLGVKKYLPNIPAHLSGEVKGAFPGFVPKTDEIRLQSVPDIFKRHHNVDVCFTEKLDGTSGTFFFKDGDFGVCSRNLELRETENNTYWEIARKYDLEEKLKTMSNNYAIQGEIVGPGIQKNRYRLEERKLFIFDIFNIDEHKHLNRFEIMNVCNRFDLTVVPTVGFETLHEDDKVEEWLRFATGKSVLYDIEREGIVVRSTKFVPDPELGRLSFKVINNNFLLKEK